MSNAPARAGAFARRRRSSIRALVTCRWDGCFALPRGPRLRCSGGRSRRRVSHVPAPGAGRGEQSPGVPSPRAAFPGAARSPSGGSRQHRCFLSGLLLASSCAAALSTSEGTFQRKLKLVKIKIIERILFYQRDCLWLANRHEML